MSLIGSKQLCYVALVEAGERRAKLTTFCPGLDGFSRSGGGRSLHMFPCGKCPYAFSVHVCLAKVLIEQMKIFLKRR